MVVVVVVVVVVVSFCLFFFFLSLLSLSPLSLPSPLTSLTLLCAPATTFQVSQGGGEQVTITGSGFLSGVAYVDVAGIACESWEVLSDTEIDCTTASFDGWVDSGNSDAHVVTGGRSWHRGAGVVELDAAMGVVPSLLAVVVAACAAVAMAIL